MKALPLESQSLLEPKCWKFNKQALHNEIGFVNLLRTLNFKKAVSEMSFSNFNKLL